MKRTNRFVFFTASWFSMIFMFCALVPLAQQKPPVFRAEVNLRQLDVVVLDRDRRPVRGLTAADFAVTEDGDVQKIEAFSFVDLADSVVREEPKWAATVASDVVTNDLDSSRVFVIFVSDVMGIVPQKNDLMSP